MEVNPRVILVSVDWTTHVFTLHRSDGAIGKADLPRTGPLDNQIKSTTWSPQLDTALIQTSDGEAITIELYNPDRADQQEGRPVVYLDQCIWRRMADAVHNPTALSENERDGASELIDLVERRKIILPLSSGHHVETTQWGADRRRYQLGLTTLQLSHGWAMRSPLTVRRQEFRDALLRCVQGDHVPHPPPIITLEPHAASSSTDAPEPPKGLPPEAARTWQNLTYMTAIASTLLDAEQIPRLTEKLSWVEVNRRFGNWLDDQTGLTGPQKRRAVDALYLNDVGQEITEEAQAAGLRPEQFSRWLRREMFADMNAMPSVGLFRSILQDRHLNVGTVWTANDLTDMIYLTAAAGYADVVVAERHMTAMLTQAQRRLRRERSVYSSLAEAMPAVRSKLREGNR